MYWFTALFDQRTEEHIKNIWHELSEKSLSYYGEEVKNARPHLTLGSYKHLNRREFIRNIDLFYSDKASIDLTFNTVGSFLNYGTLFISPTVTRELLEFHTSHHKFFRSFNNSANSLYLPGTWIPHCTLANNLSAEKLSDVFHYCLKRNDIIHGRIREVALMELIQDDEECMEAPIIYSKILK